MNSNETKLDVVYLGSKLAASAMLTAILTWAIFNLGAPQSAEAQSAAAPVPAEARSKSTTDSTRQYSSLPEVVVVADRIVDVGP
jgi:hypothetical protein